MSLGILDLVVFAVFVLAVISIGLLKSARGRSSEDYFLAGRGLSWWLIGFSLIAANISTEQFVGMSGNAASHVGLAIASFEWMAAVSLVIVAFTFLPHFLRAGIYTMPEFLEYRFGSAARTLMASVTLLIYMLLLGSVTYAGAVTIRTLAAKMGYDVSLEAGSLAIGLIAMFYVAAGGLKACAWADLIQGSALILGGAVILVFAFAKLGTVEHAACIVNVQTGAMEVRTLAPIAGALERFWDLNSARMNMFLPAEDPIVPYTALLLGLWIPNLYYWGFNQYITQRTLGSASLAQGQKGIVFAAFLKLLTPFVIVVPGIIAFNLHAKDMQVEAAKDNAPILARYLKANPKSQFVELVESPSSEVIAAWAPGRYLVALYPTREALASVEVLNPYVLPMLAADHVALESAGRPIFESEDKAWSIVNAGLAGEMAEYNAATEAAARAAGLATSTEKPIVYKYDTAMGQLIGSVLPQRVGLVGFVLAALLGAVVSSLAAMLNAASTIFSMDIFRKFIAPSAGQASVVFVGRVCVVAFTAIAIFLAPALTNPKLSNSIFMIIQESQGFVSSGIIAIFVFGIFVPCCPRSAGVWGLATNVVSFGAMKWAFPGLQFLNRGAISFGLCLAVLAFLTLTRPLAKPIEFEDRSTIDLQGSKGALVGGMVVVLVVLFFYVIFSPLLLAK